LAQLKFVEVRPQRGTYVTQIDLNYISDLLMLRTAVEKEVIYEMFTKLDESARLELVKKLEKNIEEEEKYIDEKTYSRRFGILDSEFHKTMIDSVNRYALVVILSDIMLHISRWRNFDVKFADRIHELVEEHKNIVKGIKSNDLYKAQECMAAHLETITDIYESAIKQYPKYFIS
jgi:transcriptional regulator, gntR family